MEERMALPKWNWWAEQSRTAHRPDAKCCPGCKGALAERTKNGINPKRNKWYSKFANA